jgi:murein L,D-transpeptidase YcbB/YkuD
VKVTNCVGKALILALCSVSIASCHGGSPFGRKHADSVEQSSVTDPQTRAFYEARQWKAAWDGKSEKALVDVINQAPANGLKPDLFLKQPLPKDADQREAALTAAALSYASALARGAADPKKISAIYTIPRPNPNLAAGLAQALDKGDLKDWYASLPPQTDEYRALSQAHLHFLELAAKGKPQPIPDGKPIKPGKHDKRIPLVVAALEANGLVGPLRPAQPQPGAHVDVKAVPDRYTPEIAQAVRGVQAEFGLKPDGIIRGDTIDALNADAAWRARQTAINMERLRWLERDPPSTRIDVNTAAAFLDYWRGGQHIDHREVVAGEPDKQTPQIQAPFSQLVANPKWRVPDSIAEKELSTKGQGWLSQNNFTVENGQYVQESGPKNSLGLVKFDVQDPQQIYLHDTPAKALFGLPERHRSHGCVRVQNALQFASLLTTQDNVFDKFQEALASGDEKWVKLKTEIPVRLLYHTAFFDGGRVQFRPDIYGWDDDVAMALGLVRGAARKPYQQQGEDIGP